jgi:hypothetical protein
MTIILVKLEILKHKKNSNVTWIISYALLSYCILSINCKINSIKRIPIITKFFMTGLLLKFLVLNL